MTQSATGKITGLLLGGLAATGMFTALGSAPAAQASCISAFGINNSVNCASNFTSVAIAIGNTTSARAVGLLGLAFTFGDNSDAFTNASASIAFNIGRNNSVFAGDPLNAGSLDVAINLGGKNNVANAGGAIFNLAVNLGGANNTVQAGLVPGLGSGNLAIGAFNTNVGVAAGPGPLAAAVGLFQRNLVFSFSIVKQKPGININGFKLPNTAASTPAAAGTRRSTGNPAAAAAPKAPRPSAAAGGRGD